VALPGIAVSAVHGEPLAARERGTRLEGATEMARGIVVVLVAALAILDATAARAETRGTLRFGVMALELESSSETPLFGEPVSRAVDRYNTAAAAYERASGETMARIEADDLGVTETLVVVAPGIELAGRHYFFRLEAPIGLSADLRSIGVGVYPLNLQARLRRGLAGYVSAGGTASWLDRPGSGDVGGLVAVRAAAGVRIASHVMIELGYSAFALGGSVNNERLESMSITAEDVQRPDQVIAAGEARGLIDVSLGLTF
jgi:hypothetical protein